MASPPSPLQLVPPPPAIVKINPVTTDTERIRLLFVSAINNTLLKYARPVGKSKRAVVANPPSPPKPGTPVPAIVVITPSREIDRTRECPRSQKNITPAASSTSPHGPLKVANTAAAPSPDKPSSARPDEGEPPATVDTTPFDTRRIRLPENSEMSRSPDAFRATATGKSSSHSSAGPPSPKKPADPFPAIT